MSTPSGTMSANSVRRSSLRAYRIRARSSELTQSCLPVYRLLAFVRTEQARDKGHRLFEAGCVLSEFGSRRRRTYKAHDIIMRGLIKANEDCGNGQEGKGGKLAGTSNLHFAQKYDLAPIGTVRDCPRGFSFSLAERSRVPLSDNSDNDDCLALARLPTSSSWALRLSKATKAATDAPWTSGKR